MNKKTSKGGRPTRYKKEFVQQVKVVCQLGGTDVDIAQLFGVNKSTINRWKKAHPEFCASLKEAKTEFDAKVEMALAERAIGYSHPEEKIFNHQGEVIRVATTKHYPPDTTACIFWLKNRKPKQWREKVQQEQSGEMIIKVVRTSK